MNHKDDYDIMSAIIQQWPVLIFFILEKVEFKNHLWGLQIPGKQCIIHFVEIFNLCGY